MSKTFQLRKRVTNFLIFLLKLVTFTKENTFKEFEIQNIVKWSMVIVFRPFARIRNMAWRRTIDRVESNYDRYAGFEAAAHAQAGNETYCHINGRIEKTPWAAFDDKKKREYCDILSRFDFTSVLEVGGGEMSTMMPIMNFFGREKKYYSMDLSLNRLYHGRQEIKRRSEGEIEICKANAVSLPYPDNTFDLVYSSHCLEQIPYHYREVINEMLRVSRKAVVLFEPIYEMVNFPQKIYMRAADQVRGIPRYIKSLSNVSLSDPFLLNHGTYLNRGACLIIKKANTPTVNAFKYVCPLCRTGLERQQQKLSCNRCQRIYFEFESIPILDSKYSFFIGTNIK